MEKSADALLYWRNYLNGYTAVTGIPFKLHQPAHTPDKKEAVETVPLMVEDLDNISRFCERSGISLPIFMQGVWGSLLAKYNDVEDVVFGTSEAGYRIVPVRIRFSPVETVGSFLGNIQREARQREELDLSTIQSQSSLGKELFNHLMVFDQPPSVGYDLQVTVTTLPTLKIDIRFNQQVYIQQLIKNTAIHLSVLIRQFSENEHKQLNDISCLSDAEKRQILLEFNNTEAVYPHQQTIVDLLQEQVLKTPGHTAIVKEDGAITYDELNRISNQLAYYLINKCGVATGEVVAVKLERNEFLIVALLGILKAGAVYLPLGKDMQAKRMEYIREDSGYKWVIDATFINNFIMDRHTCADENSPKRHHADHIAYIIYTSGTTGQPKGTLIKHHSLVNRLCWMQKQYNLSERDTILQKTTCTFDVSVWELLWWSIAGARVVLLKDGYEKDPEQIIHYIEQHTVTVLHFVPSMLARFLDFVENGQEAGSKLSSLKRVYASGEALTEKLNRQFHELFTSARLVNLYGPTEATIDVTCFECEAGLDIIPIGKPIDNTRVYILDKHLHMVPVGVEGTLYLAGAGLAAGYLNKPDLSIQRFINDPFYPGERMYNTGDVGKWMLDGNIEYIGRNDDQVKIRGFRIEPAEIGYQLERIPGINAAHVLKLEDRLIAFLLAAGQQSGRLDPIRESNIRAALEECLPDYMIPHHFFMVNEIPLSPSGKADKKQLINLFRAGMQQAQPPSTSTALSAKAREMAEIWANVLGIPVDSILPDKSFIEHGGDSLSMLKVVAICKKKGYSVSIKDFLRAPYLHILEARDEDDAKQKAGAQPLDRGKSTFVLSPIQQFFFDHNPQGLNFIMHASYYLHPEFSTDMVEQAIAAVIANHDAFSLRFKKEKGLWHQYYDPDPGGYLLETGGLKEKAVNLKSCTARALELINIEKGPLLYACIFHEDERPILFLACHHLIMDAVSWKIFIEELQLHYIKNNIPAIPVGHKEADYANL